MSTTEKNLPVENGLVPYNKNVYAAFESDERYGSLKSSIKLNGVRCCKECCRYAKRHLREYPRHLRTAQNLRRLYSVYYAIADKYKHRTYEQNRELVDGYGSF